MFKTRYRIVKDNYAGYEAQVKYWWWPFWIQMNCINTHSSIDKAERYIKNRGVVKYVELED